MNIIIIILIVKILTYKPSNTLYCGLFGWSGKDNRFFNRHAFTMLGLANQDRGKDSCGLYDKNGLVYGTGINSTFKNFIQKIPAVSATKTGLVIGHTRKASIGSVSPENAQPACILNENEQLKFILTHNGTLENHEDLAAIYGIDTDNLETDTQMLAALISEADIGINVLGEYIGAAALAFNWANDDSIYLFKGMSPMSKNSVHPVEERPLFIYQESPNSLYYSSDIDPLKLLAHDHEAIRTLKGNVLYKVTRGTIKEATTISRDKAFQKTKDSFYTGWNQNSLHYPYKDPYDNIGDTVPMGLPKPKGKGVDTEYCYPHQSILKENPISMGASILVYYKGRYHFNSELAQGKYVVNDFGLVTNKKKGNNKFTLYFIDGILLDGKEIYESITQAKKLTSYMSPLSPRILSGTPYPVAYYDKTPEARLYTVKEFDKTNEGTQWFSGEFFPIFTNRKYNVKDGLITRYTDQGKRNVIEHKNIKLLKYWPQ